MQKLLLLGGSRYLRPVIKAAHDMGIYVITADYLPDNYAHKFSDEYCNVSIVDKEATLKKAEQLKVDGIMSFACDPGVVTAAYVAERMGLPSPGPYKSICILQNKHLFREYLSEHGFNVPKATSYRKREDVLEDIDKFQWPQIVKPTDSAGSKGVTRVNSPDELLNSLDYAFSFSRASEIIIEDFLQSQGFSSDTDCFLVNGRLQFVSFNSQRFDSTAINPLTPAAYSWPTLMSSTHQQELTKEIQRLLSLLNMKNSIYNIETRECVNGKAYIMECSPRGGGNRLAEVLKYATGVDLVTYSIKAALGEPCDDIKQSPYKGYWAEVILHSNTPGCFKEIIISELVKENVVECDLWVEKGVRIGGFAGANEAIGTLVLHFDEKSIMDRFFLNIDDYVKVVII